MQIHPAAIVEEGAKLGDGCILHAYAFISRCCELGEGVVVHPFAVIGGDPQDLSFDTHRKTGVRVGARTVLREHVTISRATKESERTEVGADCYLMAGSHVAHDCKVGNNVIMANAALLAGHVHVGDRVFFGGGAAIHQFCRIGESAIVGGGARITRDIAPFCMAAERDEIVGLNVVGLRRRGIKREIVSEIKRAFSMLMKPIGDPRKVAQSALQQQEFLSTEARTFLEFFASGKRGFARVRRPAENDQESDVA